MAKPNNTIYQIQSPTATYEIIPHRLTDGTNVVSLPTLAADAKLIVSSDQLNIPSVPSAAGEYRLMFKKDNGVITPTWVYVDNLVHYFNSGSTSQVGELVFYDDGRASGALCLVYC